MSDTGTPYELFLSYARKDNRPIPDTYPHGWVTALRDHILADHRAYSTEQFRIFFDTDEIKDMDDWRHRILGGLRHAKILLVCLSPNYFASEYCRWEWEEYLKRQVHHIMGSDSIATVYFVELPGSSEQANARWLDSVTRGNYTDVRPWFHDGARALQLEEVQKRMKALGASLWDRVSRARRAEQAPGNLKRQNPYFVGRHKEVRDLHGTLGVGTIGVVTAVHGLGGIGKTELAVSYAHAFADCYPAGLWELKAEGKTELLPLLGALAFEPQLGFTPTEAQKNDADLLGRAVLTHLQQRAEAIRSRDPHRSAAALLLLDNVSEARLLSPPQLATLPQGDWLRIVATTRLGHESFRVNQKSLALLEVDALSEDEALELVREHQPNQQFPSAAEEAAARELVHELGGFTLAVEQVAIHLGLSEIAPSRYLALLRKKGLPSADALPSKNVDVADQMRHQDKQLSLILDATLLRLSNPAAQVVLQFAALLPPDGVPWPWLRDLTLAHHPELSENEDEEDPWREIRRRLQGMRFLTPAEHPEVARMHRLIGAHLRLKTADSMREEVTAYVGRRADVIYRSQAAPRLWELDAILVAIPHLLAERPNHALAVDAVFLSDKVITYRSISAASSLLTTTHEFLATQATSDQANAGWQRDLSISHNKLGDLAVARGDLESAAGHFDAALTIRERLAESDQANAGWQRDLSISHNKLGDLAVARGDLESAAGHFEADLTIAERLAESDQANAEWQRDLSISHEKLGNLAVAQGDLQSAAGHFDAALTIRERLAESDQANAEWQRDLIVSHFKLANLATKSGDQSTATNHRRRCWQILQGMRAAQMHLDPPMARFLASLDAEFDPGKKNQ